MLAQWPCPASSRSPSPKSTRADPDAHPRPCNVWCLTPCRGESAGLRSRSVQGEGRSGRCRVGSARGGSRWRCRKRARSRGRYQGGFHLDGTKPVDYAGIAGIEEKDLCRVRSGEIISLPMKPSWELDFGGAQYAPRGETGG